MKLGGAALVIPPIVGVLGLVSCAADAAQEVSEVAGADEPKTPEQLGCRADLAPFAAGLSTSGEGNVLGAKIMAADPVAPERWLNDWEVQLIKADGGPAPDAQLDFARPFMPIHGHDGNVVPVLESMGDGRFSVAGINFNMRGPWEVQLDVSSPTLGDDYIVINVCVVE